MRSRTKTPRPEEISEYHLLRQTEGRREGGRKEEERRTDLTILTTKALTFLR